MGAAYYVQIIALNTYKVISSLIAAQWEHYYYIGRG